MTATNMAEARGLHAALRDFFTRYVHASPDFRALGRVLTLCETAVRTVDDAYCREKLRVAAEYAAELLSQRDRAKWGHDSASGAEFLRQQILNALELYASRALQPRRAPRIPGGQGEAEMDDALKHCAELKAAGDVLRERILFSIDSIEDRLHSGPA
ncbi:MAG TPA: hypothetical protein VKE95_18490 [Burkholderiales bacterium]|nr:hypothetical protein [Burkholderiales bacterium]